MTDADLAAAVRAAVADWIDATTQAQQQMEMANPATLGAVLGLTVEHTLQAAGHDPAALRERVLQAPYCHLQGVFDASSLVDTPTAFNPVPDTTATLAGRAAVLAVHGLLRMETVSYGAENGGHLFVNLVVLAGQGAMPEKSKKGLRGHTDGVSLPFNGDDDANDVRIAPSPDLVTLVGLRNPKAVPTKLMPLDDILAHMLPGDVAELKKPQYSIHSQKTFVQGMKAVLGRELVVIDEPVLKDVGQGTYVRYSHRSVSPTVSGGAAEQASRNFEAACIQTVVPLVVQPGDVLVVSNRVSLHGRGEPSGEVGGQSRWLLRTYALDTSKLAAHKRHLGASPPHVLFP
ncbi:hypothetical protein [Paucibacter soli]|uniref:hypothetical protein n=1 Tax=Paucibacter soli TaxID=3133433 RepID=UPI0030A95216